MFRKTAAILLSASLVLVAVSFGGNFLGSSEGDGLMAVETALAATSTGGVTLSTSVQQTISLTVAPSVPLGALTPGTPVFATTSATIATNGSTGLTFQVNRNTAGQTLLHSDTTTAFPDATSWNGSNNATTTNLVGANLHFKVANSGTDAGLYSSTFWGPNDTDGASNAKYAGFPVTSQTIASNTSFVGTDQFVVSRYRIDSPVTQKSGSYSGGITYTAYANP